MRRTHRFILGKQDGSVPLHQRPQQSLPPGLGAAAADGIGIASLFDYDPHSLQHQSPGATGTAPHPDLTQVLTVSAAHNNHVIQQPIIQGAPTKAHVGDDGTHVTIVPDAAVYQVPAPHEHTAHVHDLFGHVSVHNLAVPGKALVEHAPVNDSSEPHSQQDTSRPALQRSRG